MTSLDSAPSAPASVRNHGRAMADQPRWELYRLLSDATRVRMLALASMEELAVTELAMLLRASESKVSRQAAALRDSGLLLGRKQGTWLLLRLAPSATSDAVVSDAIESGRAVLEADGTASRLAHIIAQRGEATREFFDRPGQDTAIGPPSEMACYLSALAPLLSEQDVAVDAGTGDGPLLELLAPLYRRVIALDRARPQLDLAGQRATARGFDNVRFVCDELDGQAIKQAVAEETSNGGADAVFAARVLHHAPVPSRALRSLVELARSPEDNQGRAGRVIVIDYEAHLDEALREQQADLWLGFDRAELTEMAHSAGLRNVSCTPLPPSWCGLGPDRHLTWLLLSGTRCE